MQTQFADGLFVDTVLPEDVTGAPVLCLHGLFAGSWVFEQLLPLIAARGHPAHALAFRGHPPGPPIPDIGRQSVTDYALDATAAARALDRPIIIGHSLGGLVALILAGRNLARAVVLVSPAPSRGVSVFTPQLLLRTMRYVPSLLFSRAFLPAASDIDALVLNVVPPDERGPIRERLIADSGRAAREAALGVFRIPPRAVRTPMFVVGCEHDRFIPSRVAEKVARKYDAPLHIAKNHGHFLLAEPGWQQEAGVILDWIDALPRVLRAAEGSRPSLGTENSPPATGVDSVATHHPTRRPS
ncbi:MAG TPA: alpha/beta hydrolase [Gemmatimonadaceae bacterium]